MKTESPNGTINVLIIFRASARNEFIFAKIKYEKFIDNFHDFHNFNLRRIGLQKQSFCKIQFAI